MKILDHFLSLYNSFYLTIVLFMKQNMMMYTSSFFLTECKYVLTSKVIMLVNPQVHKHVQDIQEQKREQTPIIIELEKYDNKRGNMLP